MKTFIYIVLFSSLSLTLQGQQGDSIRFDWLQDLVDSLSNTTDLCTNCDLPPIIRSYRTPLGVPRFVLFYQCDDITSTTKHFEVNGHLAGQCIVDSISRKCDDIEVLESFTLGNSILTVWNCNNGFDCENTDKSILFPPYEIQIKKDLCDDIFILTTSSPFESYLWTNPQGQSGDESSFEVSSFGEHSLEVSNVYGCKDTSYIFINPEDDFNPKILGRHTLCFEDDFVELSLDGYLSYEWSTGDTTSSTLVSNEGEVSVKVSDAQGCSEVFSTHVIEQFGESVEIRKEEDIFYPGQTIHFFLNFENILEDDVQNVVWQIGNNFFEQKEISIKIDSAFILKVSAISSSGCLLEDDLEIKPEPLNQDVYIPNAFNPYGGTENSHFFVQGVENTITLSKIAIFDRWGNLIFITDSPRLNDKFSGWDGTINGKLIRSGVYIYTIDLKYADGISKIISGTVLLVH